MGREDWWVAGLMTAFAGTFAGLMFLGLLTSQMAATMGWPIWLAFAFIDLILFGMAAFGWLTLARLLMTRVR